MQDALNRTTSPPSAPGPLAGYVLRDPIIGGQGSQADAGKRRTQPAVAGDEAAEAGRNRGGDHRMAVRGGTRPTTRLVAPATPFDHLGHAPPGAEKVPESVPTRIRTGLYWDRTPWYPTEKAEAPGAARLQGLRFARSVRLSENHWWR